MSSGDRLVVGTARGRGGCARLAWAVTLQIALCGWGLGCLSGPAPTPLDRAHAEFAAGQTRAAGALYREAAERQPDRRAEALHGLARVELVGRRPEEALKRFAESARADREYFAAHARSDYAETLMVAGRTRLARGEVMPAIEVLEALARIDADHPRLSRTLAQAYTEHGRSLAMHGRRTEAMARFERAMALRPASADAWVGAAEILIATGKKREALELLANARRHVPGDGRVRALTVQAMGVY